MHSTVCPPKKYPYNNRIIAKEGTFLGDTLYIKYYAYLITYFAWTIIQGVPKKPAKPLK
jgi:hypothetical protein